MLPPPPPPPPFLPYGAPAPPWAVAPAPPRRRAARPATVVALSGLLLVAIVFSMALGDAGVLGTTTITVPVTVNGQPAGQAAPTPAPSFTPEEQQARHDYFDAANSVNAAIGTFSDVLDKAASESDPSVFAAAPALSSALTTFTAQLQKIETEAPTLSDDLDACISDNRTIITHLENATRLYASGDSAGATTELDAALNAQDQAGDDFMVLRGDLGLGRTTL